MRKISLVLRCFVLVFSALLLGKDSFAQQPVVDSLPLTLDSADNRFVSRNLALLAQKYNIDVQKAQIIQARLFPNPNLSIQQLAYNQDSKSVMPFNKNGELTLELSQMIQLAGKRNKAVQLAQANASLSEVQFQDLIRTLKYTLHSDFYNLYYLQRSATVYGEEIASLEKVVNAFQGQVSQGNISQKEYIRVKAQLYSLLAEYNDLVNQMNDVQSELRLLIQQPAQTAVVPQVAEEALAGYQPNRYPLSVLLDSAFHNRTDLKLAQVNTQINQLNLNYQKALAVPDLTAMANYDQRGGAINHQFQVGVAMDLPFFNKNQGNIKSARSSIDMAKAAEGSTQANVQETVYRALQKAYDMDRMSHRVDTTFMGDFRRLQQQVLANYEKRNVSLLDFLDFYDSYKQNVLQENQILYNRIQSFEDLNFYTATNFFK